MSVAFCRWGFSLLDNLHSLTRTCRHNHAHQQANNSNCNYDFQLNLVKKLPRKRIWREWEA